VEARNCPGGQLVAVPLPAVESTTAAD